MAQPEETEPRGVPDAQWPAEPQETRETTAMPGYPYPAPHQYSAPPAQYSAPPAHYSGPPVHYSVPPAEYSGPPVQYAAAPAPFGYPYGPAAAVPKSRAGLMVGLTAVGLVVGLVIGAGVTAFAMRRTTTSPQALSTGGPSDTSTAAPSPTAFTGDLRTLLLTPPSTSHPFAKPLSTDGTTNADQIASAFQDPTEAKAVLQEDDFVAGAVVQWHDADDTEVLIKLYQFGSPAEAKSWQYFNQRGYAGDATKTDQSPIDGIDDSGCFVTKKVDSLGFIDTLGIAAKQDIYMLVFVYQPGKQNRPIATGIMSSQFQRLP